MASTETITRNSAFSYFFLVRGILDCHPGCSGSPGTEITLMDTNLSRSPIQNPHEMGSFSVLDDIDISLSYAWEKEADAGPTSNPGSFTMLIDKHGCASHVRVIDLSQTRKTGGQFTVDLGRVVLNCQRQPLAD